MKRVVLILGFATCMLAAGPALSQTPRQPVPVPALAPVAQESPQPVKASIPAQAPRPVSARPVEQPYPPSASSTAFDDMPNVRVEVTISYQVGQGAPVRRSASLVVASSQDSGSLRSGNQVPVPSATSFIPSAPAAKSEGTPSAAPGSGNPITSFSYRSVGLNLDARRVRVAGNKAKMDLSVEFSAIEEKPAGPGRGSGPSYPSFPTFSQNLTVVLENGKPIVIAQTSDVVDDLVRKQSVEVTATILR